MKAKNALNASQVTILVEDRYLSDSSSKDGGLDMLHHHINNSVFNDSNNSGKNFQ